MGYEADDRSRRGADNATQEQPTSKAIDSNQVSKIANMLEGLRFPATKEQIRKHIADGGAIALSVENARNTSRYIDDNLSDRRKYNNTYEIERALGLVVEWNNARSRNRDIGRREKLPKKERKKEETLPYARGKAISEANKNRIGEKARPDPYNITKGDEKES